MGVDPEQNERLSTPSVVRVEGSLESCNGDYRLLPKAHNGCPTWKKMSTPERVLYYSQAAKTWFISDDLDDQGFDKAITDVDAPFGLQWAKGMAVSAAASSDAHSNEKEGTPHSIVVTGPLASCSGEYYLEASTHNDRPVWKLSKDQQRYLFYSSAEGTWFISDDLEDSGFDKATTDVALPLGLRWFKGAVVSYTAPDTIVAEGCSFEACNGEYRIEPCLHNGRHVWKQVNNPVMLLFFSLADKSWYISDQFEDNGVEKSTADVALPLGLSWAKGISLSASAYRCERALASIRALITELGALKSREGDESIAASMQEATIQLKSALGVARKAGVSEEDVLRVCEPPQQTQTGNTSERGETTLVKVGDEVEIVGLQSESGSKLNGRKGTITELLSDKGRFKVELGPEDSVSVKPINIIKLEKQNPDEQEENKRSRSPSSSSSSSSSSERKGKKLEKEEQLCWWFLGTLQ